MYFHFNNAPPAGCTAGNAASLPVAKRNTLQLHAGRSPPTAIFLNFLDVTGERCVRIYDTINTIYNTIYGIKKITGIFGAALRAEFC